MQASNQFKVIVDCSEFFSVLFASAAVRFADSQQVGDAVSLRTTQDRQAVVDEKRGCRIEIQIRSQRVPELGLLFRKAIVMRADQTIKPGGQLDPFELQR